MVPGSKGLKLNFLGNLRNLKFGFALLLVFSGIFKKHLKVVVFCTQGKIIFFLVYFSSTRVRKLIFRLRIQSVSGTILNGLR